MKRFLLSGLAVVGVLLAVAYLFRAPLSLAVMQRVVERNLSADPLASLSDGLHVVLCGAGGPLPDPARSGPCVCSSPRSPWKS